MNQHNKHLTAEELTEENIDKEIDSVGSRWGMDILKRYQRLDWLTIATNSGICKIYIA